MKLFQVILGVLFSLLLLAGVAYLYVQNLLSPTGGGKATIEIKPGMGVGAIASELTRLNLVQSEDAFRLALRLRGGGRGLKEGFYDLDGTLNATQIVRALERGGRIPTLKVSIPEGLRLGEVAERFTKAKLGTADQYQTLFATTGLLEYAKTAKNLEGFLFPATYEFRPSDPAEKIVKTMLERFGQELTPANLKKAQGLKLSVFEWVTLASMVQAEAGKSAEMPVIAGVFLNRLEDGMPLGSDPTVAYGLGKKLPELSRPDGDFESNTPYNTYKHQGLPIGPINNPGEAALEGVLNAERTAPNGQRWLYFLHGLKGEFKPNISFQAHQRDVARYR